MTSIKGTIGYCLIKLFHFFPVDTQKIVFSSFEGRQFGDNPKAIYEAMKLKQPNYKYYWIMKDSSTRIQGAKVIGYSSIVSLYHLATSKTWVDNVRKRAWNTKRRNQLYIQTWHGGLALKRIEADIETELPSWYVKCAKHDSEMADLMISGSNWQTDNIKKSFWYEGKILQCGLPRSDVLYQDPAKYREVVWKHFCIDRETHILLYAPTFRGDEEVNQSFFDFQTVLQSLKVKWPGEWKILLRLHPNVKDKVNHLKLDKDVINASEYDNMNELICASDIVISDYSSCVFDALEGHKSVFLYLPDREEYQNQRGLYFELEKLPMPISYDTDGLCHEIKKYEETYYMKKTSDFFKQLGAVQNEHASSDCADYIISLMKQQ